MVATPDEDARVMRVREVEAGHGRGWSFLPLIGKKPCHKKWSKAQRETLDEARAWAKSGNIGLRCGAASGGLVVLDVDPGADLTTLPQLPETVEVTTGRGRHYYFSSNGYKVGNSAGKLGPNLDIRGEGGQVVFPGSIHPETGNVYCWADGRSPDQIELAPLPAWIVERLAAKQTRKRASKTTGAYGQAALEREAARVREALEGTRNDTLNEASYNLGQLFAGGLLERGLIINELLDAALAAGLSEHEARSTIDSGLKAGEQKPRKAPAKKDNQPAPVNFSSPPSSMDQGMAVGQTRPKAFALTDLGNAERLVQKHGDNIRYSYEKNRWLFWDGSRWTWDPGDKIMQRAKDVARGIYAEAESEPDSDARKKIAGHARTSESKHRLKALASLAKSEPGIPIKLDALDADPWLLNVNNGTLALRSGELRPHDRRDMLTGLCPVAFYPYAVCPTWDGFLNKIMAGNADLVAWLQEAVGYSMTGLTDERVIFVCHGSGMNGKSIFLSTLAEIMGNYAQRAITETFFVSKHVNGARNDIARLRGARFVYASESEQGSRLAESLVKDISGGEKIAARFLYGEYFDFMPTFKLWLGTNHKPTVRGTDPAIWDRIRLIPFNVRIKDSEKKPRREIMAALQNEWPGILAWAARGCLKWYRRGALPNCQEITAAVRDYRDDMDFLKAFIKDRCLTGPEFRESISNLYDAFRTWVDASGEVEAQVSKREFGVRLSERGFIKGRTGQSRFWSGIKLRDDA